MDRRRLRGRLREDTVWLGWLFLALGPVALLFFGRNWFECVFIMLVGGGILLWLRPWRADRHDAWIVRVEPEYRQRLEPVTD
jgi:protein-S-isoprenylcysteine O-methyltransferase Ste14